MLAFIVSASFAQQKPKQHVYYDTVKTLTKHIQYDPDTIAVYFKEVVTGNQIYEAWNYGYVVWQTYKPMEIYNTAGIRFDYGNGFTLSNDTTAYAENPYPFSPTPAGKFLYMNKKPVTNKVIFVIKR